MSNDEKHLKQTRDLGMTPGGRYLEPRMTGPLDRGLPWVLEFRVVGTTSTLQTQLRDSMVLGRADPDRDVFVEIDLTPYHAYTHGVSRRHAMLVVHDGRLLIKDLDSTNGTKLNDYDLEPNKEYRLRHGDEIALGQLRLQVLFAVVPARDEDDGMRDVPVVGQGQQVLVVEGEPEVGSVFQTALEAAGFRTTVVGNAVDAMGQATSTTPDVIVLDLLLADLHGPDFVRYVRKNQSRHVPIIAVATPGGYQTDKALEAGADAVLTKPVSIEELVGKVAEVVSTED